MARGSLWRRWDLHVHTPASIVHQYGGNDPWDRYLSDLSQLPAELSVLGINDYWFLEGYDRVRAEWDSGRLPNIEQLFPVVEMRTQELAGASSQLRRINVHAIFAEDIGSELIRAQFLNGIVASMRLSHEMSGGVDDWVGHVSRDSLEQLGRQIRASVPNDESDKYPASDLQVGFDNLVVPWTEIQQRLDRPHFKGSVVTAVGKAEWDAMHWGAGSIGLKKDIINRVDLVFTAAADADSYNRGRAALRKAKVLDRLLDCSDAHHYADSAQKDRLGNCLTWVNADPSFAGLLHAIEEFDDRIYVGDRPPRLRSMQADLGSVMDAVRLGALPNSSSPTYFDEVVVEFNPGFVAIIGNKGQGKSALVDVVGLLGNSRNEESFSFLHEKRFRSPKRNSAATHEAQLIWRDGHSASSRLDGQTDPEASERVTYLPQSLIDEICSDEPGVAADRFRRELEHVVFAHIDPVDRLGASSLSELLAYKTRALEDRLRQRRAELAQTNRDIARLRRVATTTRRKSLQEELKQLRTREEQWRQQEPEIVPLPAESNPEVAAVQSRLDAETARRKEIAAQIAERKLLQAEVAANHEDAVQLGIALETLSGEVRRFVRDHEETFEKLGLSLPQVLQIQVDREPLEGAIQGLLDRRQGIQEELAPDVDGSLGHQHAALTKRVQELEAELSAPARAHGASVVQHREWDQVLRSILGEADEVRGIQQVEKDLAEIKRAKASYAELARQREAMVREIHSVLRDIVVVYEQVYGPAVDFIDGHEVAREAGLEFAADLRVVSLQERIWEIVARNMSGEFQGREQADEKLSEWVDSVDVTNVDSLVDFLSLVEVALHGEEPLGQDPDRLIRKGRSVEELYDLLFGLSYLEPYFLLMYRGVAIDELSPGEKGTLLLVFYLLVDKSSRPLLLDQPDENLDSQTVNKILVPAIKEAKTRRQIVVVTHSPNVAVVADADQVVVAHRTGDSFEYLSGAIEDPRINQLVVDVLEGTWPAFRNRDSKYQKLGTSQVDNSRPAVQSSSPGR